MSSHTVVVKNLTFVSPGQATRVGAVELTIDVDRIAEALGRRAAFNSTRRSGLAVGIRARFLEKGTVSKTEAESWCVMLMRANELPYLELERHASVSTSNRHKCKNCFTCACAVVLKGRNERFAIPAA